MKVYLAARFSRALEMVEHKAALEPHGIKVTSRWFLGGHEWVGTDDDALPLDVGRSFATDDIVDIDAADVIVCFTEEPRSGASRGGRHVEFGYALATGKDIIVVGHRENVFYCLPQVEFFPHWFDALCALVTRARSEAVSS